MAQRFLDLLALRHLGLQCLRLLLQEGDSAKALLFTDHRGVSLKWKQMGMGTDDFLKRSRVIFAVKSARGEGTTHIKGIPLSQIIPDFFQNICGAHSHVFPFETYTAMI